MSGPTHVNVKVHRAFGLTAKGKSGTNDAYVQIQLGSESYKTSTLERCTEPVWNEEYLFPLPPYLRSSDVITVSVFHRSLMSLDELLGLIEIPLYKIRVRERACTRNYSLHEKSTIRSSFGKGGKARKRPDTLESPRSADSPTSGAQTPVTPEKSPEPPTLGLHKLGEIELTISFTTEAQTNLGCDLLRAKSTNALDDESLWTRRHSVPHSGLWSEDELSCEEKNKRSSVRSILDAPRNFFSAALRRSAASSREDLDSVVESEAEEETNIRRDTRGGSLRATNNRRPNNIKITIDSQCSSAAVTPASSCVSDFNMAASEGYLSSQDGGETPVENQKEEEEEEEINNHRERVRKIPGFMTIDSQEKVNKYKLTEDEMKLFNGYEREDLIATVVRQHARLTLAEAYIGDLEHYINLLVQRVMDTQPRILQTPLLRQTSDPLGSRSALLRFTKKTLRRRGFKGEKSEKSGKK